MFLNKCSDTILKVYKKIELFCDANSLDLSFSENKDYLEVTVSYDSLLIVSLSNKFKEFELLIQLLGMLWYLNSSRFKIEIMDVYNFNEKIISFEYYHLPKIHNETLFFNDETKEWEVRTKRIKIKIKEYSRPTIKDYMELEYPMIQNLFHLYIF